MHCDSGVPALCSSQLPDGCTQAGASRQQVVSPEVTVERPAHSAGAGPAAHASGADTCPTGRDDWLELPPLTAVALPSVVPHARHTDWPLPEPPPLTPPALLPIDSMTVSQHLAASIEHTCTQLANSRQSTTSRVEDTAAKYVPTGTQQYEFGYGNAAHIGKHRWAVEPLLNDKAFTATDEALAALEPQVAAHLHEEPLPIERKLTLDVMPEVMRDVLRLVKIANDRTINDYEEHQTPDNEHLYQRIQNGRARMTSAQIWPTVDHTGQPSSAVLSAIRSHLPHAVGQCSSDGRSVAVNLALVHDGDCEPVSAGTISITTRSSGQRRMAIIVRNQHTCILTYSRVAAATIGLGLSPYCKGMYHILLTDRLEVLRLAARWPLALAVVQYIARGCHGEIPAFVREHGLAKCRELVDQMPASRLRYENAVINRSMEVTHDESSEDDTPPAGDPSHEDVLMTALPKLASEQLGSPQAAKAVIKYAYEAYGLADQRGLSVMYRMAVNAGVDVTVPPLQAIFEPLMTAAIHGCAIPSAEPRAAFHRRRASAAASRAPWPADLMAIDDGPAADDDQPSKAFEHCKQILAAVIGAFPFHSSVGRAAFDMPREQLVNQTVTPESAHIHAAAKDDGATIGDALLSDDLAVVKRAYDQLQAVSKRRESRHQSSLRGCRVNLSQIGKMAGINQQDIRAATATKNADTGCMQVPSNASDLATWALQNGWLQIGELPVTRAIMYGLGAAGTILSEPFDDAAAPIGIGAGSCQAIQKVLRAARAVKLAAENGQTSTWLREMTADQRQQWGAAIEGQVSPLACIRAAQEWLGTDDRWWLTGLQPSGYCPLCRQALDLVEPVTAQLWQQLVQQVVNSCDPAWYVETDFCDLVHRLMEPTTKPKPFDLLRHHALPPWEVVRFTREADGKLRPQLADLRPLVRQALGHLPSDAVRHALTPWKHAPYDAPSSKLVLTSADELSALRGFIMRTVGLAAKEVPSKVTALMKWAGALRPAVSKPEVHNDQTEGQAHESGRRSLREHSDVHDDTIGVTNIAAVTSNGASEVASTAWQPALQIDLSSQLADSCSKMARSLPAGLLMVQPANPRKPQTGVVSAKTLRKLPKRTAVASVSTCTLTRCTAFNLVHWVVDTQPAD